MKYILLCSSILISPQLGLAKDITFESAVVYALENNVDLHALRLQAQSFREKSRQALAPNSPVLSFSKNDLPGLDPSATGANEQVGVSYTLGFPGKAMSQSGSLRSQSDAARQEAFAKEIELMSLLFVNMSAQVADEQMIDVLNDEVKKGESTIRLQETRYSLGQGFQADILNAKVALSKLGQDLLNTQNELLSLKNDFLTLMGHPHDSDIHVQMNVDQYIPSSLPELERLMGFMFKNKPNIKSAEFNVEASDKMVTVSRLQAMPDLQFSASMNDYKVASAAPVSGMTRDYNVGISFNIPLFFPLNEMAGIRSANADLEVARAKLAASREASKSELISNYTNFQSSRLALQQLQTTVLSAARASYELTLSSYARGKMDYLRLADARSSFIQTQKDLNAKKRQYAQSFFQLVNNVGCDFTTKDGPHACQ